MDFGENKVLPSSYNEDNNLPVSCPSKQLQRGCRVGSVQYLHGPVPEPQAQVAGPLLLT